MPVIHLRFFGELNDFLAESERQAWLRHEFELSGPIKDVIEGFGVPHPEVQLILANGRSIAFDYSVQDGDTISVYPAFRALDIHVVSLVSPPPLPEPRFVLDVHLGKLANHLRLLGLDTLYRNDYADQTLAQISDEEQRILLTRDQKLLMRNRITYGRWIRSIRPENQLREVVRRYGLRPLAEPFSRCLRCNTRLESVDKKSVEHLLEAKTRRYYDTFWRCPACQRVYWKGSHYTRLSALVERALRDDR